jgi:hypothetical protein
MEPGRRASRGERPAHAPAASARYALCTAYDSADCSPRASTTTTDGAAPEGQWKVTLAARFDRNIYVSVETTAAGEATISRFGRRDGRDGTIKMESRPLVFSL